MKWVFKSTIGTIFIVKHSDNRYHIVIGDQTYGSYNSAVAAADDVYTFSTGCYDWDKHQTEINYQINVPANINEWEESL